MHHQSLSGSYRWMWKSLEMQCRHFSDCSIIQHDGLAVVSDGLGGISLEDHTDDLLRTIVDTGIDTVDRLWHFPELNPTKNFWDTFFYSRTCKVSTKPLSFSLNCCLPVHMPCLLIIPLLIKHLNYLLLVCFAFILKRWQEHYVSKDLKFEYFSYQDQMCAFPWLLEIFFQHWKYFYFHTVD